MIRCNPHHLAGENPPGTDGGPDAIVTVDEQMALSSVDTTTSVKTVAP